MIKLLRTPLGRLRLIAYAEGISLLLILGITMPLKYGFGYPHPNEVIGLIHGILFILYVGAVLYFTFRENWNIKKTLLALIASIIPFGPFWADKKLFQPKEEEKLAS